MTFSRSTNPVESLYREHYGKLVATLSRRIGIGHLAAIEDAVQDALVAALQHHSENKPVTIAWLHRVAYNKCIDILRRGARHADWLATQEPDHVFDYTPPPLTSEVQDDMLRMLFACCDSNISRSAKLVTSLKVLCGLRVPEISVRLFISEANVYKTLARARQSLQYRFDERWLTPSVDDIADSLPTVQDVIYVLFTEGYLSVHADTAIRIDLCAEALRLALLLTKETTTATPATFALVALLHLHLARMHGRLDADGGLLLLEEQDRSRWDQSLIRAGLDWLARSATGSDFTKFHGEAAVAAEHCLAKSYAETNWSAIDSHYRLLEQTTPSALYTLNRAVALAEANEPSVGLQLLSNREPPSWLANSYQWYAVLADLHRRCGHTSKATHFATLALQMAPSETVKVLLQRRLMTS